MACVYPNSSRSDRATYVVSFITILLQEIQSFSVNLEFSHSFFPERLDMVQRFRKSRAGNCTVSIETSRTVGDAYFEASKISSNFFLSADGSERGQFDSS